MSSREFFRESLDPPIVPRASRSHWRVIRAYATAVILSAIFVVLHRRYLPGNESWQSLLLIPIMISAYLGGVGPGLVSTAICSLSSRLILLPPFGEWTVVDRVDDIKWYVINAMGVGICVLSEAMHRARRRAERSIDQLAATLGSIGDGVVVTDVTGKLTFMNPVAEHLTGWPAREARGESINRVLDLRDEASQNRLDPLALTALDAEERLAVGATMVIRRRDGMERPVAPVTAPVTGVRGVVRGHVIALRDATVSRRAERALRERLQTQQRLERLAATAPGILFSYKLSPDGHRSMPYASPRIGEIFGVDLEAVARDASLVLDMMSPVEADQARHRIEESARTLSPWRSEFRVRRPDGQEIWLEGHSMPERLPDGSTVWHGFLNDITERRRSADALNAARENLYFLIEQAPVSIAMLDRQLRYIACSQRWREDFGRGVIDLVGRSHYEVNPDISDEWKRVHWLALQGTATTSDEEPWLRADGTTQWLRWAVHPWRTGNGAVGGIIIFAEDISKRKHAELALGESERHYRDLVEMSPEAIFTRRGRELTYANPAGVALLGGKEPSDILGRSVNMFIRADQHSEITAAEVALARGEPFGPRRRKLVRLDGSEMDVEISSSIIEQTEPTTYQVIMRDVTERERAAAALAESEARFRELTQALPEVFFLLDAERTRFLYVSPAFERIFGYAPESAWTSVEVWRNAVHPDDLPLVAGARLMLADDGEIDFEHRILRGEGDVRWLRVRMQAVRDASGVVQRYAGLIEDVTERRALEAQLRQSQKLDSIGQLAGGIAHDFNNWLTVINGNSDLILDGIVDAEESKELTNEIRAAGDRAAALTRQLLAFSRQQVIEPRIVDLNAIAIDTERMLRRLLVGDLSLQVRHEATGRVLIDPGHLTQVIMNLALNARDAMEQCQGGILRVATLDVDRDDGAWQCLEITDTGSGMTEAVRARIFEPFFTTKGLGRGTGLGLAVVHGIVRQAGGRIEIDSVVGEGTTVRVLLPNARVEATEDESNRRVRREPQHGRILVVEDEDMVRKLTSRMLEVSGYQVTPAASGADALAMLADPAFACDLVVTDVMMPGLDGYHLSLEVRATRPGLPFLFTTGYLDEALGRRGFKIADEAFLPKPFTADGLVAKVREVLAAATH